MPGGEGVNALFCREPELGRRSEDRVDYVLQPPKHAAHRRGTEEYPVEDEKGAHEPDDEPARECNQRPDLPLVAHGDRSGAIDVDDGRRGEHGWLSGLSGDDPIWLPRVKAAWKI